MSLAQMQDVLSSEHSLPQLHDVQRGAERPYPKNMGSLLPSSLQGPGVLSLLSSEEQPLRRGGGRELSSPSLGSH
jgi:hypothetical protein